MSNPFVAYVSGIPSRPTVKVRTGPSTTYDPPMFEIPVGTANLPILDVRADDKGANLQGKTYQWFRLQFPNGQVGWTRDDLLTVSGDGGAFGYGVVSTGTVAFNLIRSFVPNIPAAPINPVGVVPPAPVAPAPAAPPPAPTVIAAPVVITPPTIPAAPTQPMAPVIVTPVTPTQPAAPTVVVVPVVIPVVAPPAAPVAPVAPAAPVPAAPPPIAPVPALPVNAPMAVIKTMGAAPTRLGPSTTFQRTGILLNRHGRYSILEVQRENANQRYRWLRVSANGQSVWIREDLVSYEGDTSVLGLPTDLYPAPMVEKYWWVRGYNMSPNLDTGLVQHDGWDLGAATGEPMLAGPNGGTVVKINICAKCTAEKPSTLMQGYSVGDPAIFNDPAWGFGYGNYVIVRYTSDQLPVSTRQLLLSRGFGETAAVYVMYAHLASIAVREGQVLTANQQIGACGNTGNSEAAHLHLESRASKSAQFIGWANIRSGIMDAVALFKR